MKKVFGNRMITFVLSLMVAFSAMSVTSAEETTDATREYAIAAFIDAADCFEASSVDELSSYADAGEVGEMFAPKLAQAVENGILKGYEDNTLRPKALISRVEALAILSRMLPESEAVQEPVDFADVPEWAKESIDRLSSAGIVAGYGNGMLGSYDNLTVDQIAILTEKVGGYKTAVYLGVENYGAEETNKDNKSDFRYRFDINGTETILSVDNGSTDVDGNFDYPIQNLLKENYSYKIKVDGDKVVSVQEIVENMPEYVPQVSGTPGEKTLLNFLKTAMEPVGTTLYIYGGGWDWQDAGSSIQTRKIGVSPDWVRFFNENDDNYTYKEDADPTESFYPYGGYNEYYYAGLDCSGYLGWTLYNTFETEDMKDGYVGGSTGTSKRLADKGYGTWTQDISGDMKPGDIMSINGHVWISLGTCSDGSTLIVHSTPSRSRTNMPGGGVQISAIGESEDCEAYKLADKIMCDFYPEWYKRYPIYLCEPNVYFTFTGETAGKFTWSEDVMSDLENVRDMTPNEVLDILFR